MKITKIFPLLAFSLVALPLRSPNFNLPQAATLVGKRAWFKEATVTKIEGTTLTVTQNNISYTVLTDANTVFKRRFGGKSSLAEISTNDKLNILGKWNNEEKTEIKAANIRDLSIQKRFATFFGEVKSVSGQTLVVTTAKKGEQIITIGDSTKLVNRKMETITFADILAGHRIRIKGLWDRANNTVTEVKQIKDFTFLQGVDEGGIIPNYR